MASDEQEKVARQFGRVAYNRYRQGGVTLSQALDAAFDVINPEKRALITAAIIASLVGVEIEDRPRQKRHNEAFDNSRDQV